MIDMNRLVLKPTAAGYSAQIGLSVLMQQLEGGAPRFERNILGVSHTVSVAWTTDAGGYQYLLAFYRVWERNPSQPFLMGLIIEDHQMQDYECQFLPNSLLLSSKTGGVFNVSAQITAKALAADEIFDQAIVDAWDSGANDWTGQLDQLTNSDLPDALENTEEVAS